MLADSIRLFKRVTLSLKVFHLLDDIPAEENRFMANRRGAIGSSPTGLVPEGLTMSVSEYARIAGVGENIVRVDVAAERIPHKKMGQARADLI